MITVHQFNNELRFVKDEAASKASTEGMTISRCEQELRLTRVNRVTEAGILHSYYAVDGVRVEDQSADGVVAALALSNARAM